MGPFDVIRTYCESVCGQIRWKKVRPGVAAELEAHLLDQRDAYMAGGEDESTATERAVAQMGDPVSVGEALDRTHRPRPQWTMIALTGILMLLGLILNAALKVMVHTIEYESFRPTFYLAALGIFLGCYFLDFSWLRRWGRGIYVLTLALSLALFWWVNGRWGGGYSGGTVFLSYLFLVYPLVYILFVYSLRQKGAAGVLLSLAAYVPFGVLLLSIPSWSSVLLYTLTAFGALCFAICRGCFGPRKGRLLALVLGGLVLAGVCIGFLPWNAYTPEGIDAFFRPENHRLGEGYVYLLARDVVSRSVFFGQGGAGALENAARLPRISTDYALTYFIHRYGLVVLLGVVLLLGTFLAVGLYKTFTEKSRFGALTAFTILLTLLLQSVFYIADSLGYGLVGAMSLPFLSYGRTALFLNSALTGFLLSVFRTGELLRGPLHRAARRRCLSHEDGDLVIHLKKTV